MMEIITKNTKIIADNYYIARIASWSIIMKLCRSENSTDSNN